MLRPLIEFQREIAALARAGERRVSVPDVGLYVGEEVSEGMRRARALTDYARERGVTLYLRNAGAGDSGRAEPMAEPMREAMGEPTREPMGASTEAPGEASGAHAAPDQRAAAPSA